MKRLLQYISHKNNHASFRPLTPRSRAHFTSTHLLPHLFLLSMYFIHAFSRTTLGGTLLLLSLLLVSASASRHECFSHASYLACMYTVHSCSVSHASYYVHASLLYLYTSHLVLRVTMHLLHTIHYTTALYLYSVLLGRAGSAVVLQRLPNIRCLLCLLCTCSTTLSYRIREWISDELQSHRGYREQHLCSVFVEDMRRGEEGFKNVACVGRGKKPSRVKVL